MGSETVFCDSYAPWEYEEEARENFQLDYDRDPTSDELSEYIDYAIRDDIDMTIEILDDIFFDHRVLIIGSIQRWDGVRRGWNTYRTFHEAFEFITEDCDFVMVYESDGHLYIKCSHHDGTNEIEVKTLTDDGEKFLDEYEIDDETIGRLMNEFSTLPDLSELMF